MLNADGRPACVDLEHDGVIQLACQQFEGGLAVEHALELVGVVVIPDADAVLGCDLRRSVELGCDLRDRLRGLPTVGGGERVDDGLDAEVPRRSKDRGLVDVAYFYERGNNLIGPTGAALGNIFATAASIESMEAFAAACSDVWFAGAVGEKMYVEAG